MSDDAKRAKFKRDAAWNFASLACLAISGAALNILILRHYGIATFGVFNQTIAAYIFFSQIAAAGINLSVLRAVAEHAPNRAQVTSIVAAGLVPAMLLALATTLAYYLLRNIVAGIWESDGVAQGIAASAPGLFFFAINKLLLGVVNGVQRMRAFAVYQAMRYLLILAGFFVAMRIELDGNALAFVFSFSEGILFLVLAVEVARIVARPLLPEWKRWIRPHIAYGMKSAGSGIMLELNARADVFMLGLFLTDWHVGIYSFASMIAEGVYQVLVVLQNLYNPILAREIAQREFDRLRAMIVRGRRWTYAGMFAIACVAIAVYPTVAPFLTDRPEIGESMNPFIALMAGMVLAAGYIPFGQTLLMAGHPGWHTGLMVGTVAFNMALDLYMIPAYGITGAAVSTSLAMIASVLMLKALVRSKVGLKL